MKALRSVFLILFISCGDSVVAQKLNLFSAEQRSAAARPELIAINFVERYFQNMKEQSYSDIKGRMSDDKVFFRNGKPSDLYLVNDTMPLQVSLVDMHYEIEWYRNDEPFITIAFPARYELLTGISRQEAQTRLRDAIRNATERDTIGGTEYEKERIAENLYRSVNEKYCLDVMNDATYYIKDGDGYNPVYDSLYVDYSAANLFQGIIMGKDYRMYIKQSTYTFDTIDYSIKLSQWLNYCAEQDLKIFFAIEEEREDGLLALVIAQSLEMGYDHMLSVVIPDNFISNPNAVLKARLTSYIPILNQRVLFRTKL